jgi:hypothetical protein
MKQKKLDDLLEKAMHNIEEDRATANKLLTDLLIFMQKTGDSSHATSGHTAAQYLETLQRSNEQLVKIAAILQKQEGPAKGLTDKDKQDIFESIKG